MILRDVEVGGVGGRDVRIDGGRVAAVGAGLAAGAPDQDVLDGGGGALLPGLHDHHLHLRALAATRRSVPCGAPAVQRPADLDRVLREAAARAGTGRWIRGVGHDDALGGPLDRRRLDELAPHRPARIQHRSGHLWILNSLALDRAGPVVTALAADGLLYDRDDLLHGLDPARPEEEWADVAAVSAALAACGVTGLTDATAGNDAAAARDLARWRAEGALLQHPHLLGGEGVAGARKIVLAEHDLPGLDALVAAVSDAHDEGRPVAVHAASRATVVLALAGLEAAGARPGDRLEHAAVAPPELVAWAARLGVTVVTNPGFVVAHGDRYRRDVDVEDRPWLYRGRAFVDAGVPLAAGSDAPFGPLDPWRSMRAAVDRRTERGAEMGPDERLSPEAALALYTGPATDPGGPARRVAPGAPADLCLLAVPWVEARTALTADYVAATFVAGALVHDGGTTGSDQEHP
ncbi:MAG: amidohydrolase family protein [Microthrixaceae bacterium]|nr:amidohydrolase family protein [Microthrixaceae bacterium]